MVSIRKASDDDTHDVWRVRNAAIWGQCAGHYRAQDLDTWTRGEVTEQFARAVASSTYVAIQANEVVGTGMIDLDTGTVDALFVVPGQMGLGVGKRMLSFLEELAIQAGLPKLQLDATLNAAPFYRKCGFVGSTVSTYESPRGVSLDCIPMTKVLDRVRRPE